MSVILSLLLAVPSDAAFERCLAAAYPALPARVEGGVLHSLEARLPLVSPRPLSFLEKLEGGFFLDQLSQLYSAQWTAPDVHSDPGRIRSTALFNLLYGEPTTLRPHLTSVHWAPSGESIPFNPAHGAAAALKKVGQELAIQQNPLAQKTLGTFNPRPIAGTTRPSAHGFGIAIDLKLPSSLHHYWRWQGCNEGQSCPYPPKLLTDPDLRQLVTAFERHGFIWGGRWHRFDAMHFEYRPELLTPACQLLQ